MVDRVKWQGIIKIRRIPQEWTEEDFKFWWLPRSVDPLTGIMRLPPRMSEEEKEGLTVAQSSNTLLINGVNTILSYVVAGGSGPGVMFKYMAVGNGALTGIAPGATSLASEFFRKAITGVVNAGSQGTVSTLFGSSDATGPWTCGGLFGINATGATNSGVLMSEVLYLPTFVKGAVAYTQDYSISLLSN